MLPTHKKRLGPLEYLQPLTSAPASIELDAKKSPLALLAQTCSQIGKPDPSTSSRSSASSSQGDKDPCSRSSISTVKAEERRSPPEDKLIFKPYSKADGDSHRGGVREHKFRTPDNSHPNGTLVVSCPQAIPPHPISPGPGVCSNGPPGSKRQPSKLHKQSPSPIRQHPHSPNRDTVHGENTPSSTSTISSNGTSLRNNAESSKANLDCATLANSSYVRAHTNSSSDSYESGSNHDRVKGDSQPAQPNLVPGHLSPVSSYKTSHSFFPLHSSAMGYHGSVVGAYASYPSHFIPGLDPTKLPLSVGSMGVPGKHLNSGASPPSFMQGLCRDPYCFTYPGVSHLGTGNCSPCSHDPSSNLKQGFSLAYPSHPLHSFHTSTRSPSVTSSLSHPLYTFGFMLPSDPLPHTCNWVSAMGPCNKRFATSDELLVHLRTHTALAGGMDGKLHSACSTFSTSGLASCHLHLPHQSSPAPMSSSFPPMAHSGLNSARYHPYNKIHLPPGTASIPLQSLASPFPAYPPYAAYSPRVGPASGLGYQ